MRDLVSTTVLLLVAFASTTEACRQKYIEWYKFKACGADKGPIDSECYTIQRNLRDYSNSHSKVWGGDITADNNCGTCQPSTNQQYCTCTIRAWRFREWMFEPGFSAWPKAPNGWSRVDPDNGSNGWYDTGHKNIDCD